jgi:hypothetical protein
MSFLSKLKGAVSQVTSAASDAAKGVIESAKVSVKDKVSQLENLAKSSDVVSKASTAVVGKLPSALTDVFKRGSSRKKARKTVRQSKRASPKKRKSARKSARSASPKKRKSARSASPKRRKSATRRKSLKMKRAADGTKRPSARAMYDAGADVGDIAVYENGTIKCLALDRNGRPYLADC